ncbi:MAG: hypothetical protein VW230_01470 [Candidatus Poseidoniales archaeon]
MAENWKYLYLHSGDELRVSTRGASIGRKNSVDSILHIDDDLPGHKLILGGSYGLKEIYTLPHGSRAIPVVTKIDKKKIVENGEKVSFEAGNSPGDEKLESGTIIFEEGVFLNLEKLTEKSVEKILKKAEQTSIRFYELAKPNLQGKCAKQKADAMKFWRENRFGIRSTTRDPHGGNGLPETLYEICKTNNPRQFMNDDDIRYFEMMIAIEFLSSIRGRAMNEINASKTKILTEYLDYFKKLESLGFNSTFVIPLETKNTLDEYLELICDLCRGLNIESLIPFIKNFRTGISFMDWINALALLKEYFPSFEGLSWMSEIDGNDANATKQMKKFAISNLIIDLLYIFVKNFGIHIPNHLKGLGMNLREANVFHHGYKVVCDRILTQSHQDRFIEAQLELYDLNGNRQHCDNSIGNNPSETHASIIADYSDVKWMVLRIGGGRSMPPLEKWRFMEGFGSTDRLPNNPWEAYVTLPWFIQYDGARVPTFSHNKNNIGVLNVCSDQLVHVHFLHALNPRECIVIIPIKTREGDGFRIYETLAKSWTTICFRAMYNIKSEEFNEVHHNENINATSFTRWWIERPSKI